MSYTRKVAFSTAAQFVGKIVGMAIALVTTAILFRMLGVEGIGKYTTAFSFVAFFALFSDIGLGWTMLRELAVTDDKGKVFRNIFTFRLILGIVVFSLASLVVWLFNYPVDVKWAVGILSVALFFQSLNSVAVQIYLNAYRMDIATAAEIVGKAIILLVVYLLSKSGGSLTSVMIAYVLGCLVNFLITWLLASKFIKIGLSFDMKYWKYAFKQALPIGFVLVFGYIYYKIDSLMLSFLKGMVDVGIYGAPYKLLEVLQIFPALFLGAAFSLVTRYANDKDDRIKPAFQKQFDFLTLLAVPIVVTVFILAAPIISFISGEKGVEFVYSSTVSIWGVPLTSVTCIKILIFSVGINFVTSLYNFMIVSLGKQKNMVWPTIGFATFNVLLNLLLIPKYSYIGASIATLLTELLVLLTVYKITNQSMRLPINLGNLGKALLAGLVMGLIVFEAYQANINLFIILAFAIAVYSAMVFLLKAIPVELLKGLLKGEK